MFLFLSNRLVKKKKNPKDDLKNKLKHLTTQQKQTRILYRTKKNKVKDMF